MEVTPVVDAVVLAESVLASVPDNDEVSLDSVEVSEADDGRPDARVNGGVIPGEDESTFSGSGPLLVLVVLMVDCSLIVTSDSPLTDDDICAVVVVEEDVEIVVELEVSSEVAISDELGACVDVLDIVVEVEVVSSFEFTSDELGACVDVLVAVVIEVVEVVEIVIVWDDDEVAEGVVGSSIAIASTMMKSAVMIFVVNMVRAQRLPTSNCRIDGLTLNSEIEA